MGNAAKLSHCEIFEYLAIEIYHMHQNRSLLMILINLFFKFILQNKNITL